MFLWKFTRGYVKIRMRCMRPEKMVNLLLAEGISLHNIERENKSTAGHNTDLRHIKKHDNSRHGDRQLHAAC